jgi:IS5 family transposase
VQNSNIPTRTNIVRTRTEKYKNHTKVDSIGKFINTYDVTDASVHDSQALDNLLDEEDKGQSLYADSAYKGEEQEKITKKYKMKNKVHAKGYRNKPLTKSQIKKNHIKSKTRARVHLIFSDLHIIGLKAKRVIP